MINIIQTLVFKDFPRQIKLSNKRRIKYYEKDTSATKKRAAKWFDPKYEFREWKSNKKWYLVDIETGDRVIANPKAAGTPKIIPISGQAIANGSLHVNVRNNLFQFLKEFFLNGMKDQNFKKFDIKDFPLILEGNLYAPYFMNPGRNYDVDNLQLPYIKPFQDALVHGNYIKDDHRAYIAKPLSFELIPSEEYKMEIFFKTTNNKVLWDKTYKNEKITL